MTSPHFVALVSVIHDEELIRLRHRLKKHKDDPVYLDCADFLKQEIKKRDAEHDARSETV